MQFTHFCRDFDLVAKYAFSQAPSCTNFSQPGSTSDSRTGDLGLAYAIGPIISGETWAKLFSNISISWKDTKAPVWENSQSFDFSWVLPVSPIIQSMQTKKQIRLASVWWWVRSCITIVPTMQFTQCHCWRRLLHYFAFFAVGWLHIASLPSSSTLFNQTHREGAKLL